MPDRPIIETPEYLRDYAGKVHAEFNRQSTHVHVLTPSQRAQWEALRSRWVEWYGSGPSWVWGATGATLDDFADAVERFAVALALAGAPAPVAPPTGAPDAVGLPTGFVWALVALAAVYVFSKAKD